MNRIFFLSVAVVTLFLFPDLRNGVAAAPYLCRFTPDLLSAGETELHWLNYAQAIEAAKSSGRKILIDVYTTWCGWCKKMDRDVYARKEVREYLKAHFEIVKLDAESGKSYHLESGEQTEKEIAAGYGVSSYPTTIFLNEKGESITAVPGYIQAENFLLVLEFIKGDFYKTTSWNDFTKSRQKK